MNTKRPAFALWRATGGGKPRLQGQGETHIKILLPGPHFRLFSETYATFAPRNSEQATLYNKTKTTPSIMKTFKTLGRQMMTCMAAMALTLATGTAAVAQTPADWEKMDGDVVLYMANDLGRNGYYEQKPVAELMGRVAETTGPELIIAAGDVHHFEGVASVNDPLWMTNYELIYSHPELMLDWNPIMGNHEYRGNTQAVIDYSKVSRRWDMPARYYTKVVDEDGTTVRIVLIDTTPLISKYREETDKYPDAARQDNAAQLEWLDNTLKNAKEDWVIVVGHHPIYAQTSKDDVERQDMQRQLLPILHKYGNVVIYACGHIHNYQHIKMAGDDIDYVVNTSGSLARKVEPTTGTVFCAGVEGFSVISATKKQLNMYMLDKTGKAIHTVTKNK